MELRRLYARRFTPLHRERKAQAWRVLVERFFSRWIRPEDTLLDLGAGYCEFVNAARARRRIAVDPNPDTASFAAPGVEVRIEPAADLAFLGDAEVDVVFSSNFLEHLPDKEAVARTIAAAFRVLRPGGTVIFMGPNARVIPGAYWDFWDHQVPLTDRSLCELLVASGFEIRSAHARFAPYTVLRWPLPAWSWLVRAFLASRPLSSTVFGQQFLIVGAKP
jgi:SAM-dependent methyltransferase